MVVFSQRDVVRNKKIKFCKNYTEGQDGTLHGVGAPLYVDNNTIIVPSPSWKYIAIIRPAEKKDDEKEKYSIEVCLLF